MKGRFCLASILIIAGTAVASTGFASRAIAGTATSPLTVSATVPANCLISTTPATFGNYDPIGTNASNALGVATGRATTTCTTGAAAIITLGQGLNPATGSTEATPIRQMASGTNRLTYQLDKTAGGGNWGNTSATGVNTTGTGSAVQQTVFGVILPAQNVPAGTYTDTVVATVTF